MDHFLLIGQIFHKRKEAAYKMATKTRQILLHERPKGLPDKNTFAFKHVEIDEPAEGEALLQMIYISVDPYMRGRMDDRESYVPPFPLHKPIAGGGIAKVLKSRDDSLNEGDYVTGNLPWQQYVNVSASDVRKVQAEAAPVSAYLSAVGMPGLTAYFGTLSIGQPKEGETFVLSGGAGAVGSLAGQIAKMQGARVVGIAGTDEKLKLLPFQRCFIFTCVILSIQPNNDFVFFCIFLCGCGIKPSHVDAPPGSGSDRFPQQYPSSE